MAHTHACAQHRSVHRACVHLSFTSLLSKPTRWSVRAQVELYFHGEDPAPFGKEKQDTGGRDLTPSLLDQIRKSNPTAAEGPGESGGEPSPSDETRESSPTAAEGGDESGGEPSPSDEIQESNPTAAEGADEGGGAPSLSDEMQESNPTAAEGEGAGEGSGKSPDGDGIGAGESTEGGSGVEEVSGPSSCIARVEGCGCKSKAAGVNLKVCGCECRRLRV
eukprot:1185040-Prorocentrum_minimum.AAC.2